ncbi:GNAT family N-acetyltransferase [Flammeovirga sp. EKP202]|uniref:GNAT family N-acetyltransferase n=1 Tax=Flammeovirga sp. EKP202 TaxID=2770592 RepID=UPI00165F0614|nr:GNAT family N-acetyltransferase [Flammeovirga sp. EKP202]MBD0400682.1 GNAT family N-acetyltransferase [Flammeovirga sp. EKP202]
MNIKVNPQIELKPLEMGDSTSIFTILDQQRDYIGKWLPFVQYTHKIEDTRKFVASMIEEAEKNTTKVYSILLGCELIGLISFKDISKVNKSTEIGYWISQDHQGRGIMTDAVRQMCKMAFEEWKMNRIVIKCAEENYPSKRIPQKIGFKYEGLERESIVMIDGQFANLEVFSLLKSDGIVI